MEDLKGYLRYPVDMRFTATGVALTSFTVYDTPHGKYDIKQRVVVWAELGEACNRELCETDKVFIKGYYKDRSWVGKDGETHQVEEFITSRIFQLDDTAEEMSHAVEITKDSDTKIDPLTINPEGMVGGRPVNSK